MQASDGLVAEDFGTDPFGSPSFHLRAISPGYDAASLQVLLSGSSDVSIAPWTRVALNQNLADLQPRNHLYLTAGLPKLAVTFPLDTTSLADGFHELTAVASEGSHVRTQTRVSLAVRIQNSSLTATLSLLDLSPTNIVQGTYHIRVAANTNSVTAISLFSTGGLLATATNQSAVTFSFNGPALGAGFHHFYALVQTSDGLQYRTETRSARLVNAP